MSLPFALNKIYNYLIVNLLNFAHILVVVFSLLFLHEIARTKACTVVEVTRHILEAETLGIFKNRPLPY